MAAALRLGRSVERRAGSTPVLLTNLRPNGEMADALDLKSGEINLVRVRLPLGSPSTGEFAESHYNGNSCFSINQLVYANSDNELA